MRRYWPSSYGWGGQSIPQIRESLQGMGFEEIMEPVKLTYIPTEEQLCNIEEKIGENMG